MYSTVTLEFAIQRTRYKAWQVARKLPSLGDVDDLQQELLEDVLRRLPTFNGARAGIKTYICRVIDHRIATLLESQRAVRRRGGRRPTSLESGVLEESGAQAGGSASAFSVAQDLALDVTAVMNSLTPPLRDLCERLQRQNPTEIAQETGLARSVIYQRLNSLREIFARAQLHFYLQKIPRFRPDNSRGIPVGS